MILHYIVMSLIGLVCVVWLTNAISLAVRQIIAMSKGDNDEFDRLSTPYDIAEKLAQRDFGISPELFEFTWNDIKDANHDALPYDVYIYFRDKR